MCDGHCPWARARDHDVQRWTDYAGQEVHVRCPLVLVDVTRDLTAQSFMPSLTCYHFHSIQIYPLFPPPHLQSNPTNPNLLFNSTAPCPLSSQTPSGEFTSITSPTTNTAAAAPPSHPPAPSTQIASTTSSQPTIPPTKAASPPSNSGPL